MRHAVSCRDILKGRSLSVTEKDASVKCLDSVLGKVHLPAGGSSSCAMGWCCIVINLSFCVCGMAISTGCLFHSVHQMSRRRHTTISPSTLLLRCRRLESKIRTAGHWDSKVLVWHHCHHVLARFLTRQSRPLLFFSRGFTFSSGEDDCNVVGSFMHGRPSLQQLAEWRNMQVVHSASTLCHAILVLFEGSAPLLFFKFVVLPTRCLLDVSCLLA